MEGEIEIGAGLVGVRREDGNMERIVLGSLVWIVDSVGSTQVLHFFQ